MWTSSSLLLCLFCAGLAYLRKVIQRWRERGGCNRPSCNLNQNHEKMHEKMIMLGVPPSVFQTPPRQPKSTEPMLAHLQALAVSSTERRSVPSAVSHGTSPPECCNSPACSDAGSTLSGGSCGCSSLSGSDTESDCRVSNTSNSRGGSESRDRSSLCAHQDLDQLCLDVGPQAYQKASSSLLSPSSPHSRRLSLGAPLRPAIRQRPLASSHVGSDQRCDLAQQQQQTTALLRRRKNVTFKASEAVICSPPTVEALSMLAAGAQPLPAPACVSTCTSRTCLPDDASHLADPDKPGASSATATGKAATAEVVAVPSTAGDKAEPEEGCCQPDGALLSRRSHSRQAGVVPAVPVVLHVQAADRQPVPRPLILHAWAASSPSPCLSSSPSSSATASPPWQHARAIGELQWGCSDADLYGNPAHASANVRAASGRQRVMAALREAKSRHSHLATWRPQLPPYTRPPPRSEYVGAGPHRGPSHQGGGQGQGWQDPPAAGAEMDGSPAAASGQIRPANSPRVPLAPGDSAILTVGYAALTPGSPQGCSMATRPRSQPVNVEEQQYVAGGEEQRRGGEGTEVLWEGDRLSVCAAEQGGSTSRPGGRSPGREGTRAWGVERCGGGNGGPGAALVSRPGADGDVMELAPCKSTMGIWGIAGAGGEGGGVASLQQLMMCERLRLAEALARQSYQL